MKSSNIWALIFEHGLYVAGCFYDWEYSKMYDKYSMLKFKETHLGIVYNVTN